MEDSARHLEERVLPEVPIRQWVLAPPSELCGLLAARGEALSKMSQLFVGAVAKHHRVWARNELGLHEARTGAVVLLQRFTNTLAVYPHLHVLVLDGVYEAREGERALTFHACPRPDPLSMLKIGRDFFARFERYLAKKGFLDSDLDLATPEDSWFIRGTREPSMLPKATTAFRVRDASTSVDDRQEVGSAGEPGWR